MYTLATYTCRFLEQVGNDREDPPPPLTHGSELQIFMQVITHLIRSTSLSPHYLFNKCVLCSLGLYKEL